MKQMINHQSFDEERALYHIQNAIIKDCVFAGPADGESVLKETENIIVDQCKFSLRYPLWHTSEFALTNSVLDDQTRAAIWYAKNGKITSCTLNGIKAIRECVHMELTDCKIDSSEFGWKSNELYLKNCQLQSEYVFLDSKNVVLENVQMKGKYSFQYVENLTIQNSVLDTKDAFWHSKNAIVKDSVVKGEYLGWYSEGLTLIHCKIIGTQPLCYCKNLTLIDCTMEQCDLSFENSDISAKVDGYIESVKNPRSGKIVADRIGKIIYENPVVTCNAEIIELKNNEN